MRHRIQTKDEAPSGGWAFLLPFRPNPNVVALVNLDVNDVWAAAHRAVLDILLRRPRREIDGYHDLLPAGIARVAGLVFHLYTSVGQCHRRFRSASGTYIQRRTMTRRITTSAPAASSDHQTHGGGESFEPALEGPAAKSVLPSETTLPLL